jgi:hypothetical protein
MHDLFSSLPLSNSTMLCIGAISRLETKMAQEEGISVDGRAYYLFLAKADRPKNPIKLLAQFFSPAEAEEAIRLFSPHSPDF